MLLELQGRNHGCQPELVLWRRGTQLFILQLLQRSFVAWSNLEALQSPGRMTEFAFLNQGSCLSYARFVCLGLTLERCDRPVRALQQSVSLACIEKLYPSSQIPFTSVPPFRRFVQQHPWQK